MYGVVEFFLTYFEKHVKARGSWKSSNPTFSQSTSSSSKDKLALSIEAKYQKLIELELKSNPGRTEGRMDLDRIETQERESE